MSLKGSPALGADRHCELSGSAGCSRAPARRRDERFHASFNLVATVHALAAIDPTLTIVMALVTAAVLGADRAAIRKMQKET